MATTVTGLASTIPEEKSRILERPIDIIPVIEAIARAKIESAMRKQFNNVPTTAQMTAKLR